VGVGVGGMVSTGGRCDACDAEKGYEVACCPNSAHMLCCTLCLHSAGRVPPPLPHTRPRLFSRSLPLPHPPPPIITLHPAPHHGQAHAAVGEHGVGQQLGGGAHRDALAVVELVQPALRVWERQEEPMGVGGPGW
jgi:hypothetical protein